MIAPSGTSSQQRRGRQHLSRRPPLFLLAGLSGASALVFENLWFRSASITLGSSMWSSGLVLSAFMAGLAVGSLVTARSRARLQRPLTTYGWIELTIGMSGLAALLVLQHLGPWLGPLFAALPSAWAVNALRLSASLGLLLVPSAAMGATLPVLMCALAGPAGAYGSKLGRVYGANTAGAVAGVLTCELILVPRVGVLASGVFAAGLNALAAWYAFRASDLVAAEDAPRRAAKPASARDAATVRVAPALIVAFLTGAIFLAFEVVALRFLLLFFVALHTNFAIVLAVVLSGVSMGGLAGGWLFRRRADAAAMVPATACLAGLALAVSYRLVGPVLSYALTLPAVEAVCVAAIAVALPLSVASGLLFTSLGHALHLAGLPDGTAAGWLGAWNTIGGAVGSLLAGFFLIGWLGLEGSLLLLTVLYGVAGLFAALGTRRPDRRWLALAVSAFVAALAVFPYGRMDEVFHWFPIGRLRELGEQRVALKEGQLETLQYLRADALGQPSYYRLITNNHSMSATDVRSRRYMRLLAHMPTMLHPAPERAALLGVGLGVTAQALTEDTRFTSIDVVDISRDIVAMLPVLHGASNPLDDPRVRLHVEDGRFFLATTPERYDVITGEPPPPHYAGVSNLYSREFFKVVADRLNPGGIATYWLPVHDLKANEARAILAAFLDAFPDATLWTGAGLDWIMLGVKPPGGRVTEDVFRGWWTRAPLADRLREIGVDTPESLGTLFIADAPRLRAWVGAAPPLTDNFPRRISLDIPRDRWDSADLIGFMVSAERPGNFQSSPAIGVLWPSALRASTMAYFRRQSIVDAILSLPSLDVADVQRLLGEAPRDPLLIKAMFWRHFFDFDQLRTILESTPALRGVGFEEYQAQVALMQGRPGEAAEWLARSSSPRMAELRALRVYCLLAAGDRSAAEQLLSAGGR